MNIFFHSAVHIYSLFIMCAQTVACLIDISLLLVLLLLFGHSQKRLPVDVCSDIVSLVPHRAAGFLLLNVEKSDKIQLLHD